MVPEGIEQNSHVKWRLDPRKIRPTSCVGDIGTHAIHLAQFVSVRSKAAKGDFHVCSQPKPLEDTAFMTLEFTNQVPVRFDHFASGLGQPWWSEVEDLR